MSNLFFSFFCDFVFSLVLCFLSTWYSLRSIALARHKRWIAISSFAASWFENAVQFISPLHLSLPICCSQLSDFILLLSTLFLPYFLCMGGYAVAHLVEALRYKSEGRGFDSRWFTGIFHWLNPTGRNVALGLTQPLTEKSTRNISWGKGDRWVGLTNLSPSCADCHEIWEPQTPGILWASPGL